MPAYIAYGLRIESDLVLPDLVCHSRVSGGDADVVVRRGVVDLKSTSGGENGVCRWATRDEICIYYEGLATLLIRQGKQITVDASPDTPAGMLRLMLLGPALAVILHQRGFLVLHASAVQIGERSVAFLGEKGAGKSTTAAAFHAGGHSLIADDVVAVAPETFLVYPAFPMLKLWTEAAQHVHGRTEDLEQLHPTLEKFALSAADRFATQPLKLARVFALQDGDREMIEVLPPQQAFMELVKNSYLRTLLRSTDTAVSHFHQAVAVAAAVPVCRLTRRRSLPALGEMVSAVVAHVA